MVEIKDNYSTMSEPLIKQIHQEYGNRIRVRACGVLIHQNKLLMLKHTGIGQLGFYWNVPGGEPLKGESLKEAVKREFLEETHLEIEVDEMIAFREFIEEPLHAIEYYFIVTNPKGFGKLGTDPENVHILTEMAWFTAAEFNDLPAKAKPYFLTDRIKIDR